LRLSLTHRPGHRRALVAGVAGLLALLAPAVVGAWTTNEAILDPGTCGRNLQVGSDRTASATARPTFLLQGDGGLSSYEVEIDGRRLGTFSSTSDAIVCIPVRTRLAEGRHVFTGREIAPNAGNVARLDFSVDTVAPAPPTRPVLSAFSDSGRRGDGTTRFTQVNLTGKGAPNQPVQIFRRGVLIVGGATADKRGRWSVTTIALPRGTHSLTAVAFDSAGNRSAASAATKITIRPR
jgi:hypothetical protein